mgnify:FL=1
MNTIKAEREALDLTDPGAFDKDNYLQALLISAEGICIMAERYAKEAERLAELEKDEERKAELLTIAETCIMYRDIRQGHFRRQFSHSTSIIFRFLWSRMQQHIIREEWISIFIHITKSILKVEESQRMKDRSFWSVCG